MLAGGVGAVIWTGRLVLCVGSAVPRSPSDGLKKTTSWGCQVHQSQSPGRRAHRGSTAGLGRDCTLAHGSRGTASRGGGATSGAEDVRPWPSPSSFLPAASTLRHQLAPVRLSFHFLLSNHYRYFFQWSQRWLSDHILQRPVGAKTVQPATAWVQIWAPPLLAVWP